MRAIGTLGAAVVVAACADPSPPAAGTTTEVGDGGSFGPATGVGATNGESGGTTGTAQTGDSTGPAPAGWQLDDALGPELGMAMSVWGPTAAEALVAGGQQGDTTSAGFVLRRTDGQWVPDPLPPDTPMLHWVGPAGADTWVVGRDGAALRWEGDAWVASDTMSDVTLWGVWGADPGDVWAVGGDGISDPPTLLHFDGVTWSPGELPVDIPRSSNALFKVWGADATHVFIAGDGGVLLSGIAPAWDASYADSAAPFIAVRGRSATDVVAVGGRANARLARFDGTGWQDATLPDPGLNGVWVDDDGAAILVGRLGGIYELPAGSLMPSAVESPTLDLLHAVHGFDDGTRIVVGGTFEGPPPWTGVIVVRDG